MTLNTFFEQFDLLADAPNGVQKLRELILQLAVQGKLVEQDPGDEPAEVLLEGIKRERKRLIKTKAIKEIKTLLFDPKEIDFELPCGWTFARLGEIVKKLGAGSTPKGGRAVYCNSGIKFLRSQNVWNHGLQLNGVACITPEIHKAMEGTVVEPGDILLNITGASIGRSAIVPDNFDEGNVSQHVAIIRLIDKSFRDYVHIYIISPLVQSLIMDVQVGISREGLSMNRLKDFLVPLPPLAEQKRIVAKVDRLMALCDRLEEQQQQRRSHCIRLGEGAVTQLLNAQTADEFDLNWKRVCDHFDLLYSVPESVQKLRQAILQLAVQGKLVPQDPGDEPAQVWFERIQAKRGVRVQEDIVPFKIPETWLWLKINDFYEVSGGIQKTPKRAPVSNFFPYLRVANVLRGKLSLSDIEYFELVDGELERWKLESGDLLIVEGNGSENEIGRCAIWKGEIENCVHQNHIIRARPIRHDGQLFTLIFFNSPTGMAEMRRLAITTSGLYSLSVGKIRQILVPVPPLAEQKRIVAKVDCLMALCDRMEAQLNQVQGNSEKLMETAVRQVLAV